MPEWIHPALPCLIGALLVPFLPARLRQLVTLASPLAALGLLATLDPQLPGTISVFGVDFVVLRGDALSMVFAWAFALFGFIAAVFAWHEQRRAPQAAAMLLVSGALGTVLAGDLVAFFFFWEWLTVGSLILIWSGDTRRAREAGLRYLLFHVIGAVVLLFGILLHAQGGSIELTPIPRGWAMALILIGLLTNAAVPPLHAWLPDAYPAASVTGTVFLSAFTTKTAVYALARLMPGVEILAIIGGVMALYGVIFAVLENDIRRLLGYHIISQVGYMVAAVGIGTTLAINGASAHAFAHIFYKGLLMMSAGAVIYATGTGKLTELGGLHRPLRWVLVACMIGAFSISGVPLFSGFVSKSIIVWAAAEARFPAVELMLVVASMGTFLHTGLKLPWFTFGSAPKTARVERPVPATMYAAMAMAAAVCIVVGIAPGLMYNLLPHAMKYVPYTADHVVQALQLLTGTALGFWILRSKLGGEATQTLDVDFLYRESLPALMRRTADGMMTGGRWVRNFHQGWIAGADRGLEGWGAWPARAVLGNQVAVIAGLLSLVSLLALLI